MDERDERLRASTAFRSISGLASQQHTSPVVSYLFETSATTALRGPPAIRQLCLQNDPTQKNQANARDPNAPWINEVDCQVPPKSKTMTNAAEAVGFVRPSNSPSENPDT